MTPPEDDHYRLLGIDALASAEELRRAWRQLALQWHPDHAGPEGAPRFRQLAAAYAVLSDPAARAAYDRCLRATEAASRVRSGHAQAAPTNARAPAVMMHRLSGSLDSLLARGIARRLEPDVFDLYLDGAEWAEGGMVMISMQVDLHCPICSGGTAAKSNGDHTCLRCRGARKVRELFSAWLAIRPKLPDGTRMAPSVSLTGMIQSPSFRVHHQR